MKQVTIRGKRWNLIFQKIHHAYNAWGFCDDPRTPNKSIYIDSRLSGRHLVEIVAHEILHASCNDLDEEAVDQYAKDLSRILDKLGLICD